MSEPYPNVELDVTAAMPTGSDMPQEASGLETVAAKKDADEKHSGDEVKVGKASDIVEEVKDGGGENGVKEKNVAHEVEEKDAEETKDGNEKDKVEVTKEINKKNSREAEMEEGENNGPKETEDDGEEKMGVEEMKNESQDGVEELKNAEVKDNVERVTNCEGKDSVEEKDDGEEKMDEGENNAGMVKDEEEGKNKKDDPEEGKDKKNAEDVEMIEAENVKDEEEVKLSTVETEENEGIEVENKDDMKEEEEGGNTEEVDEKGTKGLKKKRSKRGRAGAKKESKEKKEGGKNEEEGEKEKLGGKEEEKEGEKEKLGEKEEKEGEKEKKLGEKEEEKEGEKKAKDLSHTLTPPIERPLRERKTVERLVEVIEKEPNKRVTIEKGRGTPLKDIPNVAHKLARKKPRDLKLLHQTLFGKIGKAADFKHHILQFSGFMWRDSDEKQLAKIKEKLDKCVKDTLLDLCDLFDISASKTNIRKEELLVKLLDFLAAPHATTEVILVEKDEQKRNSGKRKRVNGGSASKSREDMVVKQPKRKRTKSVGTLSNKGKGTQDSEDGGDNEEEDSENGITDEAEKLGPSESEKENGSEDAANEEDDSEDSGKGKQNTKNPSKVTSSTRKEKMKMGSNSKKEKVPSVTSAKSPTKTPTGKRSIRTSVTKNSIKTPTSARFSKSADESNDVGENLFSRNKKTYDSPKKNSASKLDTKEKSNGREVGKGKPKSEGPKLEEAGQYGPRTAQLRKIICEFLTEVGFNTAIFQAIFSGVLKRLATRYKVDLTPRKSSIKQIIKEELTKLADAAEEDKDDGEEEDASVGRKIQSPEVKT